MVWKYVGYSSRSAHSALISSAGRKLHLRIKNTTKNMRNENGIIFSFRWISWHRSSLLPERSLKRGQLPSCPYLTWLSLPFQCFSFIVVFSTGVLPPHLLALSNCRPAFRIIYPKIERPDSARYNLLKQEYELKITKN